MIKPDFPSLIGFPISDFCNLNCPHCLRGQGSIQTDFWYMTLSTAKELSKKISGKVQMINLSAGYGEPYLNPNVSEILEIFHRDGVKTIVYTNASESTHSNILKSYTDYLLISMDSFHCTVENGLLKQQMKLLELINKNNSKHIANKIIITTVIDGQNFDPKYIYIVTNLCETYDFVSAEFHWKMNYNTDPKNFEDYSSVLTKYKAVFDSVKNSKIQFPAFEKFKSNMCSDLFHSLYFDRYGNARNCCVFMNSFSELNIFRHKLNEIWNSSIFKHLRHNWVSGDCFPECNICPIGYGFLWKKD